MEKPMLPQGLSTSLLNRLRNHRNPLYLASLAPRGKRSTTKINYAEDYDFDFKDDRDDDYDDDEINHFHHTSTTTTNNNNTTTNLSNFQGKEAPKDNKLSKLLFDNNQQIDNSLPELLVPIKLNVDSNGFKINDLFLWNLNELLITPELYINILSQDLELTKSLELLLLNQFKEQLEQFKLIESTIIPQLINEKEYHVILNLNISLDNQLYEDKIEWDLLNTNIKPEEFAKIIVKDMGLSRDFQIAIAYSIYDSIYKLKKEFIESPQQLLINNEYLPILNKVYQSNLIQIDSQTNQNFIGNLISNTSTNDNNIELQGLRYDLNNFGSDYIPKLETLTQWEIEKREIERERNFRRQKRESQRIVGGGNDRERIVKRRYDELEGTWKNV
ncbi:hypothetical protein CANARDRAFT_226456 [[Candida] arabinofermentans NRRL YB-2248]|uniref:Chromatin structure-remodeling complex subunit SFH1 n=1 Tax=[Candida] arabinofermentans NRRL YB-2248 TaxID=983967 RepID=A0A1E4SUI7_9ASCO|nr:hypothetical protein CANARDRAFT_226456 [[Candida] arabinofermentans NRRL YB-2248]